MTIAHKKQFKIAGAIWLVIVMIICQIVPAFASPATDDNGNWLPSSFYAGWFIWDVDSSSYVSATVTSSVTRDGLTFTFPYNTYGVSFVGFNLYASSAFDLSSVYIDGSITYASDLTGTSDFLTFSASNCYFLYGSNSSRVYIQQNDLSNPFTWTFSGDNGYNDVSSFIMNFRLNPTVIDGVLTISFKNFLFNGEDITPLITVQNLDNASEDLGDLANELAVPTPNSNAIFNGMDDAINHVNDSNYQSTYSFFKNDSGIMATYITIVLAMATLGYIFFGKRSA